MFVLQIFSQNAALVTCNIYPTTLISFPLFAKLKEIENFQDLFILVLVYYNNKMLFHKLLFQVVFFQLLKLNAHCEDHKFHSCLSAVHIYDSYSYIFTIIGYMTHYHRVYDELTIDHLFMQLGNSVNRALHRYRKVMGSNPVQV